MQTVETMLTFIAKLEELRLVFEQIFLYRPDDKVWSVLVRLNILNGWEAINSLLSVLVLHERLLIEVDGHVQWSQVLDLLV